MVLTEKTVSWLCSYSILLCVISALDLHCPHSSHRQIQAKAFCNRSEISKYSCLYDINNHLYTESCNRSPDYVSPGKKYVIMGSRTGRDCCSERYQPFTFWSNELSDCVYLKSLCSEIGQKIYDFRSREEDSSCSCDYTKGYGFVTQPRNIQYCIPSKEDCSCFLVQCPDNNTLSPDYKCRPGLKNENNSAENMETRIIKPSISDEDDGIVVDGRWPMIIILVFCICCIVIAFIFVFSVSEDSTFTITIKGDERCDNLIRENAMTLVASMEKEFEVLSTHVTNGCVVMHIKSDDGNIISRLTDSIRRGPCVRLIEELCSCSGQCSVGLDNSSSTMKLAATQLKFEVKTINHPLLQLISANKAFLLEEIDPRVLIEAFSKRGFDHFKETNKECIHERRLRTAKFLDILENELLVKVDNFMDVFIEILEDRKMNFVVKRLKLYQKMQLIGAALLKKNIIKHMESIVDEVKLKDMKDEIISRNDLCPDVVEKWCSQYPEGSEERCKALIEDILGLGDSAVFMFRDILFNIDIDSSLLEELSDIEQVSDVTDSMDDNENGRVF